MEGGELETVMECRRSSDVVGVSILRRDDSIAELILASMPALVRHGKWEMGYEHTFEAACFCAYKFALYTFA